MRFRVLGTTRSRATLCSPATMDGVFHRQGPAGARGNKLKLLVTGLESHSGTGERYHQRLLGKVPDVGAHKVLGEGVAA